MWSLRSPVVLALVGMALLSLAGQTIVGMAAAGGGERDTEVEANESCSAPASADARAEVCRAWRCDRKAYAMPTTLPVDGVQVVSWPYPGPFPAQAFRGGKQVAWRFDAPGLKPAEATVRVTNYDGSQALPVRVAATTTGLSFEPDGWTPEAGRSYVVEVSGAAQPVRYRVSIVNCD